MQRVLVIGPCGAGKSAAAIELGHLLDLPVYPLDRLHWREGWIESSREELLEAFAPMLAAERWLIDGNYGGTMSERVERADTVVYLDYPTWICLWRALQPGLRLFGPTPPANAPRRPATRRPLFFLFF